MRPEQLIQFVRVAAFILLGFSSATSGAAQTYDAYATADSVTIGERFEIVVAVEHDGSRAALFPHHFLPDSLQNRPAFEVGGFTFLGNSAPSRRQISGGWVIDSLRYEVATFEVDSAYVPMLPIGLASPADTLIAGTPDVLVWIKSLVPEDADSIRDITGLADFPGIPLLWYILPVLLLLIGYLLWRRYRKPVKIELEEEQPEPAEPPLDEANRRLRVLEQMDLTNPDNVKPFYIELSELLRTYIARRVHVPALETTTRELIVKLQNALNDGVVPEDIVGELNHVLSSADLVKFADMRPGHDSGREALSRTRSAIVGTEEELEARERARKRAEAEAQMRRNEDAEIEIMTHDE